MAGMSMPHCSTAPPGWRWPAALVLALLGGQALPAHASPQLALDKGCYNCHGRSSGRNAPSLDRLAADYARYRGQAQAAARLAERLRQGSLLGHIAAHERLSADEAQSLMQWLIDGANQGL